ncbi:MAG: restriction endonuclease subunit S [Betaproteobacteria bacterium]|nr:restriction endonuclease subunit S [Betaproteobacteria bacterium]
MKPPEKLRGLVPESFETYQIVDPGNIIVRTTDLQNDHTSLRIGHSQNRGIITSAHMCLETTDRVLNEFGYQFLNAYDLLKIIYGFGSGLRQNLDFSHIKRMPVLVPSHPEQAAIARFLDHADRRIRRYIRAKQTLNQLLEEQKQAIIHRAVTRGLDPNVRLKPSGVEWLGEVPEHWEVLPLRRRWTVTDCKHLTVPFLEDGVPLASVREVQSFNVDLTTSKRTTTDWYETLVEGGRSPRRGDLIYCRNVSVGAAAFVDTDERFAMGQDVCLIRSERQNQRYLNYFLHGPAMDRQLAMLLVGSTFDRINVAEIKGLIVLVPPRVEQNAIAKHLDQELREIDRVIQDAARETSLLREYRTRLIADVVTGKLDVHAAAAKLRDEADVPEAPDDSEALVENEEDTTDGDLGGAPEEAET